MLCNITFEGGRLLNSRISGDNLRKNALVFFPVFMCVESLVLDLWGRKFISMGSEDGCEE